MRHINSYVTMVNANYQFDKVMKLRSFIEDSSLANEDVSEKHASETTMERICSWLADEVVIEWLDDRTIWTKLLDFGEDKKQLQCVSST